MKYLGGDTGTESDFEGDSPEIDEETPDAKEEEETHNAKEEEETHDVKEEEEEQVRAVLITGSFSAYVLFPNLFLALGGMTSLSAGNL